MLQEGIEPRPPLEIHHFEENKRGHDFIVGDLHGCAYELMQLLEKASFNPETDRLFCVGDLADRGPDSLKCCRLLFEPWFFSTLGNHDEVLMHSICSTFSTPFEATRWIDCQKNQALYYEVLEKNGGQWAIKLLQEKKKELIKIALKLLHTPTIITVGTPPFRFNLVHAGFYRPEYGNVTDDALDQLDFEDHEDWSKYLLQSRWLANLPEIEHPLYSPGLSRTYCGHTPIYRPVRCFSHYCINTGSGNTPESNKPLRMTLVDHHAEKVYSCDTAARKPPAWMTFLKRAAIKVESLKDAALSKPTKNCPRLKKYF